MEAIIKQLFIFLKLLQTFASNTRKIEIKPFPTWFPLSVLYPNQPIYQQPPKHFLSLHFLSLHFHRGVNQITLVNPCTKNIFISKRLKTNETKL